MGASTFCLWLLTLASPSLCYLHQARSKLLELCTLGNNSPKESCVPVTWDLLELQSPFSLLPLTTVFSTGSVSVVFYYSVVNLPRIVLHYSAYSKSVQTYVVMTLDFQQWITTRSKFITDSKFTAHTFFSMSGPLGYDYGKIPRELFFVILKGFLDSNPRERRAFPEIEHKTTVNLAKYWIFSSFCR